MIRKPETVIKERSRNPAEIQAGRLLFSDSGARVLPINSANINFLAASPPTFHRE
jgi:hypothetical protein